MKAIGLIGVGLGLATAVLIGLAVRGAANQEFSTPAGPLAAELAPELPAITRATLVWSDVESPGILEDEDARTRVFAGSEEWVEHVFTGRVLPSSLRFKAAVLDVQDEAADEPTVYEATRTKFRVRGGEVFVTQTRGFMSVVYRPQDGWPGAAGTDKEDLRNYLGQTVAKLFRHAEAMLFLGVEVPFEAGFSLEADMMRILLDGEKTAAEVFALDPELPRTPGGIHSQYWGSFYFCTNGREVVATFNKVTGGKVFAIDSTEW